MKHLWNEYKKLWREEPGFMIVVHVTVIGGIVVIIVAVLDLIVALIALIAWLLILAAIAQPCLMRD